MKKADVLLTQSINQIQAETGLSRTEWQILNTLQESKGITLEELHKLMKPFGEDSLVESILHRFKQESLVEQQQDSLYATLLGQQLHRNALALQDSFREQSMQNIAEAEYQTTISTLQKLIANLEKYYLY